MPSLDWLPPSGDFRDRMRVIRDGSATTSWSDLLELSRRRLDFIQTNALDQTTQALAETTPTIFEGVRALRLAVLGSSTVSHLQPGLRVGCLRRGTRLTTVVSEFGNHREQLLDAQSELCSFDPDYVLFALDAHDLCRSLEPCMRAREVDDLVEAVGTDIARHWRQARATLRATVLQQAALPIGLGLLGNNEHRLAGSMPTFLARLNQWLRRQADEDGVHVVAVDHGVARYGLDAWHNGALWHRSKQEIAPPAVPMYGDLVARLISAADGRSAKCLVLDLDNTIWGGVVGDDGLEGIVLGQGSAQGEAFLSVQRFAIELSQRGIILAVCSKNDETVAQRAFDEHPEMMLKRDRIASFVANWDDKATNIRRIARELNIGLDALVFLDDNPFERDLVRQELPEVWVPELPDDPAYYARTVADAGYFEAVGLTDEDRSRSALYQANLQRRADLQSATDMDGYLRGLRMTLTWGCFTPVALQRIVQLINKTNQFNLTTERMTEDAVRAVMQDGQSIGLQFRLTDRLGDNGIIAAIIARQVHDDLQVTLWLMSCRVLGRRVEQATLDVLVAVARARGNRRLVGIFRPSSKNAMVAGHYHRLGFHLDDTMLDGSTVSSLVLSDYTRPDIPMTLEEMTP